MGIKEERLCGLKWVIGQEGEKGGWIRIAAEGLLRGLKGERVCGP